MNHSLQIVFLAPRVGEEGLVAGSKARGVDYLRRPPGMQVLLARIEHLRSLRGAAKRAVQA